MQVLLQEQHFGKERNLLGARIADDTQSVADRRGMIRIGTVLTERGKTNNEHQEL